MNPPRRRYNNPGIPTLGIEANNRRSRHVAALQSEQAQRALELLAANGKYPQWIVVLRHRADNPTASLRELAETMSPPMTKNAYASQLRRALRILYHPPTP